MEFPIFLNSRDGVNSKSHDFTIRFNPELVLEKNKKHYVALDSINMSYSWYNLSSSYNNNKIKYSHDSGSTWTTVTFQNGNYSYEDINNYLQQVLEAKGQSKTGNKITFIPSVFRVYIELETDYQLDLRTGDFNQLIGFNKVIVTSTTYGTHLPDITRSVDALFVHTNIISDSIVSGIQSDVLYRFSVDDLTLSFPFHIEGKRILYNKISTTVIKDLRIYITDELGRPVDLNNIGVNMTLLIKTED